MTATQAKQILSLYRPGSADDHDAEFVEALRVCKTDPDLGNWLDEHCAAYSALQSKFRQIPIPEGLKEQIISERKAHMTPLFRRPAVLASLAAAALILFAGIAGFWIQSGATADFRTYRVRMASTARRNYGMELESADPAVIRSFLAKQHAFSEYSVPAGLAKAQLVGCTGALSWKGHTIAMICFKSGRPLPAGQSTDLWLLITDDKAVSAVPTGLPALAEVNGAATATWKTGNKLYLLIGEGDEKFLRQYL